jgi:hypothetical protein
MGTDEMAVFHNDDDGYEAWVGRYGGYVLTISTGRSGYMLHHSECSHLTKDGPDIQLTKKPRRWARQRRDLFEWVVRETGEHPKLCQNCM